MGWSSDGTRVLVRAEMTSPGEEEGATTPFLRLSLVDLSSQRATRSWTILTLAEKADAALRGARWKAAEAELVAAGVVVDGQAAPLASPWSAAGRSGLTVERGSCDDGGRTYALRSGDATWPLATTGCGAEEGLHAFSGWAAPGGRGLFLVATTGCTGVYRYLWVSAEQLGKP